MALSCAERKPGARSAGVSARACHEPFEITSELGHATYDTAIHAPYCRGQGHNIAATELRLSTHQE
jgi:hypothetical protein